MSASAYGLSAGAYGEAGRIHRHQGGRERGAERGWHAPRSEGGGHDEEERGEAGEAHHESAHEASERLAPMEGEGEGREDRAGNRYRKQHAARHRPQARGAPDDRGRK